MVFRKDKVSSFHVYSVVKMMILKFFAIFMDILCETEKPRQTRVVRNFSNKSAPKLGSSLLRIISLDLPLAASS